MGKEGAEGMSWEAAEERGREQLREWGMQGAAEGIG